MIDTGLIRERPLFQVAKPPTDVDREYNGRLRQLYADHDKASREVVLRMSADLGKLRVKLREDVAALRQEYEKAREIENSFYEPG
jgi:hypothetical protein